MADDITKILNALLTSAGQSREAQREPLIKAQNQLMTIVDTELRRICQLSTTSRQSFSLLPADGDREHSSIRMAQEPKQSKLAVEDDEFEEFDYEGMAFLLDPRIFVSTTMKYLSESWL